LKIIFLVVVALFFVLTPAYGALSDATGLVNRLDVQTGGYSFEVESVSNFDIPNFEFDEDEKKLTLYIKSGLENNLGELLIPRNLLGGNFTFYLNAQEYFPQIKTNDKISFITLNFTGSGDNTLDIFGTTYLSGLTEITLKDISSPNLTSPVDYGSLYLIILLLLVGGFTCVIIFIIKKRK
jgi:hypothetical protein